LTKAILMLDQKANKFVLKLLLTRNKKERKNLYMVLAFSH
jgi:hypothetical protein